MRVHQEEKKYLCPKCGYKCKWATQLKYHMTKHTGSGVIPVMLLSSLDYIILNVMHSND